MEASAVLVHDIVIVGAGIAGLTTSLGLHKLGIRSLVLESSDSLRVTGFAIGTWSNAWKALDVVGVGDELRRRHKQITGIVTTSLATGQQTSSTPADSKGLYGGQEFRCVMRKSMLEALARELPRGTIRFSSKVDSVEDDIDGMKKILHLADGTTLRTKVLVGCDGVNSVVSKWLGLKKVASTGRYAIRGIAEYSNSHGFESKLMQFFGKGIRSGAAPCDDQHVYWGFTWTPTKTQEEELHNPVKLKQFVSSQLEKLTNELKDIIVKSNVDELVAAPLKYRRPWELLWGNISKDNVCVAGDAFHPMTPDAGQGGCSALEDAVVLARCLGEAFSHIRKGGEDLSLSEYTRIEIALKKYADERRWRGIHLIWMSYVIGNLLQTENKLVNFIRDNFLSSYLTNLMFKMTQFDCGELKNP